MASFAPFATTGGERKHAWTKIEKSRWKQLPAPLRPPPRVAHAMYVQLNIYNFLQQKAFGCKILDFIRQVFGRGVPGVFTKKILHRKHWWTHA